MATFGDSSHEEKTESPSSYRREEFRRQGSVAMSRELLSVALLLAVGGSLYVASSVIHKEFLLLSETFFRFGPITDLTKLGFVELELGALKAWGWMILPVFAAAMIAVFLTGAAQVGFLVSFEPLTPKWERLNPVLGLQRIFSWNSTMEAAKALVKLCVAGAVIWFFLKGQADGAGNLMQKSTGELTLLTLAALSRLFFSLVSLFAVLAALDYGFQRYRLEQQMKMSRREAKEEFKLREGDPLIKARIKSIQRRMASRRMMDAVPKADVVVTNPTHFAVALKYDVTEMAAPKVVAKGTGNIALKIREIARFNRVPIVENKPLARTLYKEIEVGHYIPRELYKAVAEVLAYVYRLRRASGAAI